MSTQEVEEQEVEETEVEETEVEDRGDEIETEDPEAEDSEEIEDEPETEEEEGTEEDEEGTGEDEDGDESESEPEPMLPKHRYDTVQARNRALQERIDRMEEQESQYAIPDTPPAGAAGAPDDQINELDGKINDALMDGDKDAASQFRRQQRDIERQMIHNEMQETTQTATTLAREQVRLDAAIDFLEENYPAVNPDNEAYSQELVDEMEDLRVAFEASGTLTATQAALKAAKYVFPGVTEVAPQGQQEPKQKAALKKAVKRAVSAAGKQPPELSTTGQDASSGGIQEDINVNKLTMEDMSALPEATQARLRGDIL